MRTENKKTEKYDYKDITAVGFMPDLQQFQADHQAQQGNGGLLGNM